MAKALTTAELITEIRRDIDEETASTSYFSDADIIAYMNRTLEWVGNGIPIRTVHWTITGDGSSKDFTSPEQIADMHTVIANTFPQPRISYASSVRGTGVITLLNSWITAFGFSMRLSGSNVIAHFEPALDSGETRDVYFTGLPGTVKETPYSTGTVDAVTNGDATVTGSGTTWTTNVAAGDAIVIDNEYYVVSSVTSNTELELTETYRGTTVASPAALSYEVGGSTGLSATFNDLIRLGVQWRLERKENNPNWTTTRDLARREFWTQSATVENIVSTNHSLGLAL